MRFFETCNEKNPNSRQKVNGCDEKKKRKQQ